MWVRNEEDVGVFGVRDKVIVVLELFNYGYIGAILTLGGVFIAPPFLAARMPVPITVGRSPISIYGSLQIFQDCASIPPLRKMININFYVAFRSLCDKPPLRL